jgi:glycerol-3-phosphate acyltransferase PlsY
MLVVLILLAYLCGALPFSVWIGQLALGRDVRRYGDGNPGAFNVLRAGGAGWFVLAMLLDFLKGALPVALAQFVGHQSGWALVLIAAAPVLGHATSPFLRFRGGKGLAVTFGIWAGVSLFVVPVLLGVSFAIWTLALKDSGWAVMAGLGSLLVGLLSLSIEPLWLGIWLGTSGILIWKHWPELRSRPQLRQLSTK